MPQQERERKAKLRQNPLSLLRWGRQILSLALLAAILINLYCAIKLVCLKEGDITERRYQQMRALIEIGKHYPHTWLGGTPVEWLDVQLVEIQDFFGSSFNGMLNANEMEKQIKQDWNAAHDAGDRGSHNGLFPTTRFNEAKHPLLILVWMNTYNLLLKLTFLLASLPWFVLAITVGLTDGLVQRQIRKYELGRESTFIFHKLGGWILNMSLLLWFVYLLWNDKMNPLLCFTTMAALLGLFTYHTSARFKKYL